MSAQEGEGRANRGRAAALGLAIVLAPLVLWRALLALPLIGWDAYPLIAASRVESTGDVARVLTSELMGGRYPLGHYWRPLVHATFAADHALWGLEPLGYHLTDLAVLGGGALATFALAWKFMARANACDRSLSSAAASSNDSPRRTPGRESDDRLRRPPRLGRSEETASDAPLARRERGSAAPAHEESAQDATIHRRRSPGRVLAACVAAALFAAHPVHFEILQATARRADLLCTAFAVAALAATAHGRRALAVLASLAALASKETGVAVAPAIFLYAACTSSAPEVCARLRDGFRAAWPALAATALWFAVRASIVGGLGGEARFDLLAALTGLPRAVGEFANGVFGLRRAGLESAMAFAILTALALAAVRLAWSARETSRLVFLAAWLIGLAAVTGTSGVERAWYELPFVPVLALFAAWTVSRGVELARERRVGPASAAFLIAAASIGPTLAQGPLVRARADVAEAGVRAEAFLERFEHEVRVAAPGSTVHMPGFAMSARASSASSEVSLFAPYSLEAFAELAVQGRRVRAVLAGSSFAPPAAGEVLVVLSR